MDAVEVIGLVKIDVLAQGGLAVMRDAKVALAQRGANVDLKALEPWQDAAVWEMISSGGARAVHHIESLAMTGLCRQCNAGDIDTLIAVVSVIRPGAANGGKKLAFTRQYQGGGGFNSAPRDDRNFQVQAGLEITFPAWGFGVSKRCTRPRPPAQ